ncbi:MAG TPA: flagellar hook-length control protein FliK [Oculatellaceae cyanobacterium]|jgi:flagellar hook-length control protein FliK
MQLFNFLSLNPIDRSAPSAASNTQEDGFLEEMAAQFTGMLNQALMEQAAPQADTPAPVLSETPQAPMSQAEGQAVNLPLDESTPSENTPAQPQGLFFPLNIVSTLQSLFHPEGKQPLSAPEQASTDTVPQPVPVLPPSTEQSPLLPSTEEPTAGTREPQLVGNPKTENLKTMPQGRNIKSESKAEPAELATILHETNAPPVPQAQITTDQEPTEQISKKPDDQDESASENKNNPSQSSSNITAEPYLHLPPLASLALSTPDTATFQKLDDKPEPVASPVSQNTEIPAHPLPERLLNTVPFASANQEAKRAIEIKPFNATSVESMAASNPSEALAAAELSATDTSAAEPLEPEAFSSRPVDFLKEKEAPTSKATTLFSPTSSSKPSSEVQKPAVFPQQLQQLETHLQALNGKIEHSVEQPHTASLSEAEPESIDFRLPEAETPVVPTSTAGIDLFHPAGVTDKQPSEVTAPTFIPKSAHLTEQVAEGTIHGVKNGHKELVIRLNPENLGEVRVNLTAIGEKHLSARLIASSVESHDTLQSSLNQLKTSLEAQGVQLEHISVVIAGGAESGSTANDQQGHARDFQQPESQQQKMGQQSFNQQQDHTQTAFQMGQHGQYSKSAYAQAPAHFGSSSNTTIEPQQKPTSSDTHRHNDNGHISILV